MRRRFRIQCSSGGMKCRIPTSGSLLCMRTCSPRSLSPSGTVGGTLLTWRLGGGCASGGTGKNKNDYYHGNGDFL